MTQRVNHDKHLSNRWSRPQHACCIISDFFELVLVWFECNTTNLGNKMRYKPTQNIGAHIQWVTTSAAKGRGSFRCHRFWWRTCSLVQSTEDWRPSHLSNRFPLALTLRLEASENHVFEVSLEQKNLGSGHQKSSHPRQSPPCASSWRALLHLDSVYHLWSCLLCLHWCLFL